MAVESYARNISIAARSLAPSRTKGLIGSATRSIADRVGPWIVLSIALIWTASLVTDFRMGLSVLTALGFSAAVIGVWQPFLGLVGVGILCTLDAATRVFLMSGGLLRYNTFNYWLLLVILLGMPLLFRRDDIHCRILQALIFLLVLELIWSPDFLVGAFHVLNAVAFFGLLVYFMRGGGDDRSWYWLALITGVVGAGGGLVFYVQRSSLDIDHNAISYLYLTPLFAGCLACRVVVDHQTSQVTLGTLMAVNFCWVFLTNSRGGLLVAIVCICIFVLQQRGNVRRLACLGFGIFLSLAIASQFGDDRDLTVRRVESLLDSSHSLRRRTSGRYNLAVGAVNIFVEHPLGVGTGGYSSRWARLSYGEGPSGFKNNVPMASHTAWLKVAVENGIPGIILLSVFVSSFVVAALHKWNRGILPIGLLATGVLCVAFASTEFHAKGLWFLAAGATMLLSAPSAVCEGSR